MITSFNYFLIKEIADTVVEPNIIKQFLSINQSTFWIKIKDRIFIVNLGLHGGIEGAVLKIDFMLQVIENDKETYSSIKTNEGDPLLVMSNVVGVIREWLSSDMGEQSFSGEFVDFSDVTLIGLWINSKSEVDDDRRRSNMYRYYITKNFEKLGIKILEEKDITKSWNDSNDVDTDEKYIFMQYKIEPITIGEIRKNL